MINAEPNKLIFPAGGLLGEFAKRLNLLVVALSSKRRKPALRIDYRRSEKMHDTQWKNRTDRY